MKELKEELEEKIKDAAKLDTDYKTLESERDSIAAQLQLAIAKSDSETLARSITEEQLSDVEKEKTILELELKEAMTRHKADLKKKEICVSNLEDSNKKYARDSEELLRDKGNLNNTVKKLKKNMETMHSGTTSTDIEIASLMKQLEEERLKKIQVCCMVFSCLYLILVFLQ